MTLLARLALAGIGGYLSYASFEPLGWWWAGIIGLTLLSAAFLPWGEDSIRLRSGALIGFVFGLGYFIPLLPWVGALVGPMPYIALAITESLYFAFFGIFAAPITRLNRAAALGIAAWFVTAEYIRSTVPFGGFAWGRLAWGQVEGPLAKWTSIGGPALVTFMAIFAGACIANLLISRRYILSIAGLVLVVSAPIALSFTPAIPDSGSVNVAAIQGNVPRMGLDFNAQRRAVLANHARVTTELEKDVDLVFWPENSSDVNPFADEQARTLITDAVKRVDAPTLVGTITVDEVGPRNTMVVFNPDGTTGDYHHKKYLQPFGEYMPMRDFFRNFSDMVDLAGNFQPGTGNGIVHMDGIRVGVATCYEVAFDAAARSAVNNGAEILTTPTNNATFGYSNMTYQQMAMSRMRAIELDRAVVIPATSGSSALVRPDGSVIDQTEIFEPATLVDTLPLRNTITIAARYGSLIELALVLLGAIFALVAYMRPRARG